MSFPNPPIRHHLLASRTARHIARLAGLAVLAIYLVLVSHFLGWRALALSLFAAGPSPALLVIAGLLGSYLLRALRIRAAEPAIPRDGLPDVIRIFAAYNLSNWLLPARLGEASLPLLLHSQYRVPLLRGAGVLLWLRLLDLQVISVLAGLLLALQAGGAWHALGLALVATGLLLPWLCLRHLPWLCRRWPRARELTGVLPQRTRDAAGDIALAWAAWIVKLAALGAALSLVSGLPCAAGMLGALGGDVSGVLPLHAPLGAGSYEAGVLLALGPLQTDMRNALAAAVQLHALMLAGVLILGGLALPALTRHPAASESENRS